MNGCAHEYQEEYTGRIPFAMLDGAKLRAQLKVLGLTGCAFARRLNVDPSTISKILANEYPGLKLDMAERIAFGAQVPLCTLLKDAQPPHAHAHPAPPPAH